MRYIVFGSSTPAPTLTTLLFNHPAATVGSAWNSTENTSRYFFPFDARITNFIVDLGVAPGAGQSRTYTLYKNGSSTGLTVTISDAAKQASISTVAVDVATGDSITIGHASSAAPAAPTRATWSFNVETFGRKWGLCGALNITQIGDGTRRYWYPVGPKIGAALQVSDTINSRFYFAQNCTIKSFYIGTLINPGDGKTWTFTIYKNGSAEASSDVAITGAATKTGYVTGLNIAISTGDYISLSGQSTNSPANNAVDYTSIEIEPEVDGEVTYANVADNVVGTSTQYWPSPAYPGVASNASETLRNHIIPPNTALTTRGFYWVLAAAPGAGGSGKSRALRVRKNAADANNVTTISETATTGSDLTSIDTFVSGDFISTQSVPTSTPATSDIACYFKGYIPSIFQSIISS